MTNTRGDVTELRTSGGSVYATYTYDSWGRCVSVIDGNGEVCSSETLAVQNSIRYRGYVYDNETDLYYLQSRYYDPETGRFLNADDVDYIGYSGEQLSYNMFAYCENEPVNDSDPRGYYSRKKAIEYAKKWWDGYNPLYKKNGWDCANFVSQCLYAGGLSKMTGLGSSGWHHYSVTYPVYAIGTWYIVNSATIFQISDAWGIAPDLFYFLTKTKNFKYKTIKTENDLKSVINKKTFSKGDVAFFVGSSGISHAVLLGKTVYTKSKENIYYFAHTSPRDGYNTKSKAGLMEALNAYELIYIVKIK